MNVRGWTRQPRVRSPSGQPHDPGRVTGRMDHNHTAPVVNATMDGGVAMAGSNRKRSKPERRGSRRAAQSSASASDIDGLSTAALTALMSATGRLPGEPGPLPDTLGHASRKPLPQLARGHAQLTPVVTLVRGKVTQEVLHIGREVLPGRARYAPAIRDAQLDETDHPIVASRQRLHELRRSDTTQVDEARHFDTMGCAEALDPPAPAVVNVGSNHAHREPWNTGDTAPPHRRGQMLDQVHSRTVIRPPRRDQPTGLCPSRHYDSPPSPQAFGEPSTA